MRLENLDNLITKEAKEAYQTLLRFWLYALPIFVFVVVFLNYSSDLHPKHSIALLSYIVSSFVFILFIYKVLHRKNLSSSFIIIFYFLGISYPLISPLITFIITMLFAPDFAISIMNHTIPSLFIIMTMSTGFTFSFRISSITGIFSASLFSICYFWLRSAFPEAVLAGVQSTGLSYFVEVNIYILITGLLGGLIANQARNMLLKIYESIQDREYITGILGEYVSEEVRDKILEEGSLAEEGEEKEVTVLFADLRNFTSLSEERSPKDTVSFLNDYFDTMVDVIHKHGGVIDKFIGDALMAYFGAPIPMQHPSRNAFKAAIEMNNELEILNQKLLNKELPTLKHGIGLHHGRVILGNIGSKKRKNYTIIGDTVNLASRLEGLTKQIDSDLIISNEVYLDLEESQKSQLELLSDIQIKGKKNSVICYKKAQ
ncbi:adenylate/guanylate cyclase domain-containing protein [Leptospira sp. GIMC2001]|uniref:adenylate/guanylate cyclase domain-containing protein n=1 Tax=Leptospira sp. GIMC2001 TaxID=1513297 RepID=UPI00234A3F73|nr:adenylate/guanylate cyclase domain-containing protein [Leptospira sp. GIMC2001]WCL49018.1 adenylate/guanylate cyclase domain-containing protein [Leptospira sp. GIMC2001]